jgi:hypothetical protein
MKYYIIRPKTDIKNPYIAQMSKNDYYATRNVEDIVSFKTKSEAQRVIAHESMRYPEFWCDAYVIDENELIPHLL